MTRLMKMILGLAALASVLGLWLVYPAPGVPVLAYHGVNDEPERYSISPAAFEEQMKYLAEEGYTAISLKVLSEYMVIGRKLPGKPVVITFDDGYEDNLLTALPIMEKYGMRATVFVIPGAVGQPGYLSWEQIRTLHSRGTEIGSHTLSHVALTEITQTEKEREAAESKAVIERETGGRVEFLAYPYGKFDPVMFEVLQKSGYVGACSGIAGRNRPGDNLYSLKRVNIPRPRLGLWEFRLRLLRADIYSKLGI